MITATRALQRLQEGNTRFTSGERRRDTAASELRRGFLVSGQAPFAVILGCSDSRVPVEFVFDQDLGDLFVIRVAGNIVAPSQIGSVEYAVATFGTALVVVLGHSRCGAVTATLDELQRPSTSRSPNLRSIVGRIRPAVEDLLTTGLPPEQILQRAVRDNVRASVNQLRRGSELLEPLIERGDLLIVGAEYSLETGVVDFFDGVPD